MFDACPPHLVGVGSKQPWSGVELMEMEMEMEMEVNHYGCQLSRSFQSNGALSTH